MDIIRHICVWLGLTLVHAQGLEVPLKCPVCELSADVGTCLNNMQGCTKGMCRLTTTDRCFYTAECVSPSNCTTARLHTVQGIQTERVDCCTDEQCFHQTLGVECLRQSGQLPTQKQDMSTFVPLCLDDPTFPCAKGACAYRDIHLYICPVTCGMCETKPTVTTPFTTQTSTTTKGTSPTTSDTKTYKPKTQAIVKPTIATITPLVVSTSPFVVSTSPLVVSTSTLSTASSTDRETKTRTDPHTFTATTESPSAGVRTSVKVLTPKSTAITKQTTSKHEVPSTVHTPNSTPTTPIKQTNQHPSANSTHTSEASSRPTGPSTSSTASVSIKTTHRYTTASTGASTTIKQSAATPTSVNVFTSITTSKRSTPVTNSSTSPTTAATVKPTTVRSTPSTTVHRTTQQTSTPTTATHISTRSTPTTTVHRTTQQTSTPTTATHNTTHRRTTPLPSTIPTLTTTTNAPTTAKASTPTIITATSNVVTRAPTTAEQTATTTTQATTTTPIVKETTTATTTTTTTTMAPVTRKCFQCGDIDTGRHCTPLEFFRPTSVTCPPERPFCMTDVIQSTSGGMAKFYRRCISLHTCETEWYATTSDQTLCTRTDPTTVRADITCSYCCTEDNCNKNVVPDQSTLYVPHH